MLQYLLGAMPDQWKYDDTIDDITAYKRHIASKPWVKDNYLLQTRTQTRLDLIMSKEFLWVEKYRPNIVEDCILPDSIKEVFQGFGRQSGRTSQPTAEWYCRCGQDYHRQGAV